MKRAFDMSTVPDESCHREPRRRRRISAAKKRR